jgi:hypothetical protein
VYSPLPPCRLASPPHSLPHSNHSLLSLSPSLPSSESLATKFCIFRLR